MRGNVSEDRLSPHPTSARGRESDRRILLCADSTVLAYPELIGLPAVRWSRIPWLVTCSRGMEARSLLARNPEYYREAWIVSADDIEGINVAAAVVRDNPGLSVYLISERPSGSLLSRAQSAGVTATLTNSRFVERFERIQELLGGSPPPPPPPSVDDYEPLPGTPTPSGASIPENPNRHPSYATHAVDPDPFGIDAAANPMENDQALRLSIERLRTIALAPEGGTTQAASHEPSTGFANPKTPSANPRTARMRSTEASGQPFDPAPLDDVALERTTVIAPTTAADPAALNTSGVMAEESSRASTAAVVPSREPQRSRRPTAEPTTRPACVQTALRPAAAAGRRRPAVQNGFLISVLSAGGGAGKSTVAALVAARIARRGLRVALLDCDLQFGDMAAFFGRDDAPTVDGILADGALPASAGASSSVPYLIAAPGHVEQSETVDIVRLLEIVLPRFDVVVANTGAGWGDAHACLMESSSRVLFLVDQRASSVRACLHGLDLCRRCGIATSSFLYVLNRCSKSAPFSSIDLSCALKGASVVELREGGFEVEELLGSGLAIDLAETTNPVVESIAEMLDRLLPERLAALAEARSGEEGAGRGRRRRRTGRAKRRNGGVGAEVTAP